MLQGTRMHDVAVQVHVHTGRSKIDVVVVDGLFVFHLLFLLILIFFLSHDDPPLSTSTRDHRNSSKWSMVTLN